MLGCYPRSGKRAVSTVAAGTDRSREIRSGEGIPVRGSLPNGAEGQRRVMARQGALSLSAAFIAGAGGHGGVREKKGRGMSVLGEPLARGDAAQCQGGGRHPLGVRERLSRRGRWSEELGFGLGDFSMICSPWQHKCVREWLGRVM